MVHGRYLWPCVRSEEFVYSWWNIFFHIDTTCKVTSHNSIQGIWYRDAYRGYQSNDCLMIFYRLYNLVFFFSSVLNLVFNILERNMFTSVLLFYVKLLNFFVNSYLLFYILSLFVFTVCVTGCEFGSVSVYLCRCVLVS